MVRICAVVALSVLIACVYADPDASSRFQPRKRKTAELNLSADKQADVDEMVSNLLHWIQGLYQQKNRKARQYYGGKPEKPRPFEPANTYLPPVTGYPPSGNKPSPSYNDGPVPQQPTYQPSQPAYQPSTPGYEPSQPSYPSSSDSQPQQPSYVPSSEPENDLKPSEPAYQPSSPAQPDYQPPQPVYQPDQPIKNDDVQISNNQQDSSSGSSSSSSSASASGSESSSSSGSASSSSTEVDDEDRHPPHIHEISVECGKDMMTINIEFNKIYNGIIYSQDHYNEPDCLYVKENSGQIKYSFTVSLNTCGTRFFSDFENEGQAYLENVLVLQNEPGIQEVWDHIRRVRCLWEGNLKKQLVSSLSVGMLNQITSNFSGDTAMARLDIQTGRGPFAPEANGLIRIGETMTLVVSVTGDAGFDIVVRECIARDSESRNVVPLTDSNGCVLKPKIFGAFQKTRETGNTGASVIAFAFFNAFKFPDEMDLIIQCEVELCKTDCDVCPNPGSIEPRKRRKREIIHIGNRTQVVEPSTIIGKGLRVVFPEELPEQAGFCLSPVSAVWGGVFVLFSSLLSSLLVTYCWQKSRLSTKLV